MATIKIQTEFQTEIYKAETIEGRKRFRANDDLEIWPAFYFNPNRGSRKFFATPIAKPLYYDIEQYINSGLHNKSLLKRGARPGGMFSSSSEIPLTDEQFERLQNQVNMYFSGPNNAGRPMLGENLKFEPMITSNRDMDYATLVKNARTAIYGQFRIPLPMVNSDSQTYSNYETSQVALYDRAVLPMARFIYGQLGKALLYRYGRDWQRYEIRYEETDISGLQMRRSEVVKLRKQIGVNTVNELRTQLGDEPVDGGDVILRPANEIPALDGAVDAPEQPADKSTDGE
jgi:HK97 family phage portal protein